MKMYGPYFRKDQQRWFVAFKHYDDGRVRTKLYSRYLMEQHLGRILLPDETVDHINQDKQDDRIENLQILSRSDHAKKDAQRVAPFEFTCPTCKQQAFKRGSKVKANRKQGKAGPFCSRSCAGKHKRP